MQSSSLKERISYFPFLWSFLVVIVLRGKMVLCSVVKNKIIRNFICQLSYILQWGLGSILSTETVIWITIEIIRRHTQKNEFLQLFAWNHYYSKNRLDKKIWISSFSPLQTLKKHNWFYFSRSLKSVYLFHSNRAISNSHHSLGLLHHNTWQCLKAVLPSDLEPTSRLMHSVIKGK